MSCQTCTSAAGAPVADRGAGEWDVRSVTLDRVAVLVRLNQQSLASTPVGAAALAGAATAAAGHAGWSGAMSSADSGISTSILLGTHGDVVVASSVAAGNSGDIVLRGSIGPIPYEMRLNVQMNGTRITVTLNVVEPLQLGPFTWHFDLLGVIRDPTSQSIIAAAGVAPAPEMPALPAAIAAGGARAAGLNWWCVLKCGGRRILPTLVGCLPSLATSPAGYVACVVAKIGLADAAEIAKCVAEQCTK